MTAPPIKVDASRIAVPVQVDVLDGQGPLLGETLVGVAAPEADGSVTFRGLDGVDQPIGDALPLCPPQE